MAEECEAFRDRLMAISEAVEYRELTDVRYVHSTATLLQSEGTTELRGQRGARGRSRRASD